MNRQFPDAPSRTELECLITWPQGTVDAQEEREAIEGLLILCQKHGFGRIPQLANEIEDLWRFPEKRAGYKASKKARLDMLRLAKEATS